MVQLDGHMNDNGKGQRQRLALSSEFNCSMTSSSTGIWWLSKYIHKFIPTNQFTSDVTSILNHSIWNQLGPLDFRLFFSNDLSLANKGLRSTIQSFLFGNFVPTIYEIKCKQLITAGQSSQSSSHFYDAQMILRNRKGQRQRLPLPTKFNSNMTSGGFDKIDHQMRELFQ